MNSGEKEYMIPKKEMLKLGKIIQEKKKEIEELFYQSTYLTEQRQKIYDRKKAEDEHFKNKGTDSYILGIGDVEFKKLIEQHAKDENADVLCDKINKAYEQFKDARQKLALSCYKLVHLLAKKYGQKFPEHFLTETNDFAQAGHVSSLESTIKYDYTENVKFNTWVQQRLMRGIQIEAKDNGRCIRIPRNNYTVLNKIKYAKNMLVNSNITPNYELIGRIICKEKEEIETLMKNVMTTKTQSIDQMIEYYDDKSEQIIDKKTSVSEEVLKRERKEIIKEALNCERLSDKEREVLKKRFGLIDGKQQYLKEIGLSLNLSIERIRQIEEEALAKIKRNKPLMKKLKRVYGEMME